MGYFSNGSEGMGYQEVYCERCQNNRDKGDGRGEGCAVWDAHTIYNYEDCNKSNSPLHVLIPMRADGENKECAMFLPRADEPKTHNQQEATR